MAAMYCVIYCPPDMLRVYDMVGTFGLLLLVFWGGGLLGGLSTRHSDFLTTFS